MNAQDFINQSVQSGVTMPAVEFFQKNYDQYQDGFDGETISGDCAIADAMNQMGYSDQEIYTALDYYFHDDEVVKAVLSEPNHLNWNADRIFASRTGSHSIAGE